MDRLAKLAPLLDVLVEEYVERLHREPVNFTTPDATKAVGTRPPTALYTFNTENAVADDNRNSDSDATSTG